MVLKNSGDEHCSHTKNTLDMILKTDVMNYSHTKNILEQVD